MAVISLASVKAALTAKGHTFTVASPNNLSFANHEALLTALKNERTASGVTCTGYAASGYATTNKSLNGYNSLVAAIPPFKCQCYNEIPACSPYQFNCTCNLFNSSCTAQGACTSQVVQCTCDDKCLCDTDCSCNSDDDVCNVVDYCICNSEGECPTEGGYCSGYSCSVFSGCSCYADFCTCHDHEDGCGVQCPCNEHWGCDCEAVCTSNTPCSSHTYIAGCGCQDYSCTCNSRATPICPCNSQYST